MATGARPGGLRMAGNREDIARLQRIHQLASEVLRHGTDGMMPEAQARLMAIRQLSDLDEGVGHRLHQGCLYNHYFLTLVGWTEGDGSGHLGYSYLSYFSDGRYLGPDAHGIEPLFVEA